MCITMVGSILRVIIIFWILLKTVQSQSCAAGTEMGVPSVNVYNNFVDTNTGQYYLICDGVYNPMCCGVVDSFEYYLKNDGTIQLMIWRPIGGGSYNLVGSVSDIVSGIGGGGIQTKAVINGITVESGDCIGWYTSGVDMVTYKPDTFTVLSLPAASVNTAASVDWSGATTTSNRGYAIKAILNPSNSPVFASTTSTYPIADTTLVNTVVGIVTYTDSDIGDSITLSATITDSAYFTVTDNGDGTGTIRTDTSTAVLALSGQTSSISFTATDSCGNSASNTITIPVINDPPGITNLVPASTLSEDIKVETSITSYTCADASDDVTAAVVSVSPSNTPSPEFFFSRYESGSGISGVYGIYARAQSDSALGVFNYNTQRDYVLNISCTDSKDTVYDSITINLLQNEPPEITNLPPATSITVSQTVRLGDVVFTISFNDPENDTVTFTFTCDPTGCPFDVLDSGQLQATANIDTVGNIAYDMTVTVSDAKNSGTPRKLTIVITDGLAFSNLPDTIDVEENTVNPSTLFTISYTGVDAANAILSMPYSALFGLTSPTGEFSTIADINYEALTTTSYTFPIVLSDGIANITNNLFVNVIDVNENLTWNSATYRTSVGEGAAIGTIITDPGFAITDPDVGDTYACTMNCGTEDGYYSMSTACVLTVSSTYSLDVGLSSTVTCTVTAVDSGGHIDTTTLIIDVADADNFTPAFDTFIYSFTTSAYAGINTYIGNTTATDKDAGTFGQFTYSLDQTSLPGNYFKIDGSTGEISTQVNMPTDCACSQTTFTVLALATDTGGLVGTSTVYISVFEFTTTTTTTTTDRYRKFFEDPRNIAWFAVAMAALLVAAVMGTFVIGRFLMDGTPCKMGGGRRRYNIRPPPRVEREYYPPPERVRPDIDTVRRPPPPKETQQWRHETIVFREPSLRRAVFLPKY